MAKRRNIYHIKEIIDLLKIFISSKKVINFINKFMLEKLKNCAKFFDEFYTKLEELVPKEETLINIDIK